MTAGAVRRKGFLLIAPAFDDAAWVCLSSDVEANKIPRHAGMAAMRMLQ
jgi:hypothetical protein